MTTETDATSKAGQLALATEDGAHPPRRRTRAAPAARAGKSRAENAVKATAAFGAPPAPVVTPAISIAQPVPTVTPAPSSLAEIAGKGMAVFEDIVLPTPAQVTCIRQMDTLRIMGLHQPEGQQRRAFRYLNDSGSGKSTCAKLLKKHVDGELGRDPAMKPVLHVTLSTTGTPKSLATSILNAFEDGYSTRGETEILLERVKKALEEFKVELLIIDELNHFKQKHLAQDAANTIKNILTLGWAPIVLMGTTDAKSLFTLNRELKKRCSPQVILQPFVHTEPASVAVWTELLRRLDLEMVARGLLPMTSGLGDPILAKDLCEASNGLIGDMHNIILAALEPTLLAGETYLSYDRLVDAIDTWCLADGTIDHNPLRLRRER